MIYVVLSREEERERGEFISGARRLERTGDHTGGESTWHGYGELLRDSVPAIQGEISARLLATCAEKTW